jgi:hypothetical protein
MTEIKLYKSPLKSLKLTLISSPFVAGGIWLLLKTNDSRIMATIMTLFFGLGLLIGLFNFFDRRPQIIINETGIWDRTSNQDVINWEFIQEILLPLNLFGQVFVPLVVDPRFVRRKKLYKWASSIGKAVNVGNVNLNVSLINLNIEKFVSMLDILRNEEITGRNVVIEMYRDRI